MHVPYLKRLILQVFYKNLSHGFFFLQKLIRIGNYWNLTKSRTRAFHTCLSDTLADAW